MKNLLIKTIVYIILITSIAFPCLGAISINISPTVNEESTTTLISEELDAFSEIETEEVTTQKNIMIISFEDKLERIRTEGHRPETTTSSPIEITESTVIQEKKTQPKTSNSQITTTVKTTIITTTEPTTETEITESILEELEEEIIEEIEEEIEEVVEELYYVMSSKYPNAAIVWNYLRDLGYNKAVCAGILGNMMAEVGGQTLALQPHMYDDGYYGICQWSLNYYPSISGADIYTQLNFLANTIRSEMNNFGYKYYSGFNYGTFLDLTDPGAAAKAFAMCYERCASWTYSVRVSNAYKAYDYFA